MSCVLALTFALAEAATGQPGFPGFEKKGGPGGETRKILARFDKNGDKRLDREERDEARKALASEGGGKGFKGGMFKGGGFGREEGKPGPKVTPADVRNVPDSPLYDAGTLRTLFLEFENADWEAELAAFYHTDVEVPATLIVDGKKYPNVGIHFRGASSYFSVPVGSKRSLNLSLDFVNSKQRLYCYKTLNLLNSNDDPSLLSTVLYSHIGSQYVPTPKANFVKVVINGESWGVYVNVQQFNQDFLKEHFKTSSGARWKVKGSPGGGGGLDYLGDDPVAYKSRYAIKSKDDPKAWKALIDLCKTLHETPVDKLEAALRPIVDLDELLWFLALDITLINQDGYWVRASDYSIYYGTDGRFRFVPHDMNEAFKPGGPGGPGGMFAFPRPGELLPGPLQGMLQLTPEQQKKLAELQKETDAALEQILTEPQRKELKAATQPFGPGGFPGGFPGPGGPKGFDGKGPGGPGGGGMFGKGGGIELDPLSGLSDARKPLRSKVLAVPALREKYLYHVRTIADKSLAWENLGPVVARYRALIEKEVALDTRKLTSLDAFLSATAPEASGPGPRRLSLRDFADQRRRYLMAYRPAEPKEPTR